MFSLSFSGFSLFFLNQSALPIDKIPNIDIRNVSNERLGRIIWAEGKLNVGNPDFFSS